MAFLFLGKQQWRIFHHQHHQNCKIWNFLYTSCTTPPSFTCQQLVLRFWSKFRVNLDKSQEIFKKKVTYLTFEKFPCKLCKNHIYGVCFIDLIEVSQRWFSFLLNFSDVFHKIHKILYFYFMIYRIIWKDLFCDAIGLA